MKTGIVLLNLGGPTAPEDIRPFLLNLFSDRQIIRLGPAWLQPFIARCIVKRRAPKSEANYRLIGGASPILQKTVEQAQALEKALAADGDFMVRPCMRYWHPFAAETLREMQAEKITELIALPLYPHYSAATSGSSFIDLERHIETMTPSVAYAAIRSWPAQELYIQLLAQRVREGLAAFEGQPTQLIYSAHSLPLRFIREGDPYVQELETTIAALEAQTGIKGLLGYQSRSGPVAWLGPSTPERIQETARRGIKNVLILPISFVSDHVETLVEIDIEYRRLAEDLGLGCMSTRALNSDPQFIEALRALALAAKTSLRR